MEFDTVDIAICAITSKEAFYLESWLFVTADEFYIKIWPISQVHKPDWSAAASFMHVCNLRTSFTGFNADLLYMNCWPGSISVFYW